jgi:LmbE family N-acetylglucosaminyl deacetylase
VRDALVDLRSVTGGRNLLVLAASPGDESLYCGGLIAQACARGRPPFVAVLTDGSAVPVPGFDNATPDETALRHARQTLRATGELGVPGEWFLVLGFQDGTVPTSGRRFDAVVDALSMIMWRRDCNVIAVPWRADTRPDYAAGHQVGVALAATDGVGLITYRTSGGTDDGNVALRLKPAPSLVRRSTALAAHPHIAMDFEERYYPQS